MLLSLLRSASGRPKLSTRRLTLRRQTAVVESSTAEQELQDSDSIQFVQELPLEQPAQHSLDTFAIAKHLHESHRASPDGLPLPPTTAASSIAYDSMLRVQQSSSAGAWELDALLNVPGVNSVEKSRIRTTPAEATHEYLKTYSSDLTTLSYVPPSSRRYDQLHSPPSIGPVHPRVGNEYKVRVCFAKLANELIHGRAVVVVDVLTFFKQKVGLREVQQEHVASITPTIDSVEDIVSDHRTVATSNEILHPTHDLR